MVICLVLNLKLICIKDVIGISQSYKQIWTWLDLQMQHNLHLS